MNTQITVSPTACDHIRKQVELTRSRFSTPWRERKRVQWLYVYAGFFGRYFYLTTSKLKWLMACNICIHQEDVALVTGTEIDMVTQGLNSALVFKNSNAQSYCGCGESFALSDQDTNGGEGGENSASVSDLATDATAQT